MSQRGVPEFFAFYPYEFLSDENVLAMSLEQVGAYLLLIISQWINGSIPSDIPMLARILKRSDAEMEALWAGVAPCFRPHPELPGRLIQPRVETERANAIKAIEESTARQAAYRERKKRERELLSCHSNVTSQNDNVIKQNSDMTKPSNLVSSYSNKEPKREDSDKWREFQRMYPTHRFDEDLACQMWLSRADDERILSGLRAWLNSEDWTKENGKYVPMASRFIADGKYKLAPAPKAPAQSIGKRFVVPDK